MTVSVTEPSIAYAGAGSSGPFAIPFKFLDADDVLVLKVDAAGVTTTLIGNTITGAGDDDGGSLTTANVVAVGETLRVLRQTVRTQPTRYVANGPFPASTHERALDKAMLVAQELDHSFGRTLRAPIGETAIDLPAAHIRANLFLGFDSLGRPAAGMPVAGGVGALVDISNVAPSDFALKAFLADGDRAMRSLFARLGEVVNGKAQGMVGDYVADDTDAFEAAILLMLQTGKPLHLPEGRYKITRQITIDMSSVDDPGLGQIGAASGLMIFGDGHEKTQLDLRGVTASPFMSIISSSAAHYPIFEDLSIFGNEPGTVFAVGAPSLVGPEMNFFRMIRCRVQNFNETAASNALTINALYGGTFESCILNCGSGGFVGGNGVAVICRQAQFVTADTCSIGSAFVGWKFQEGSNTSVTIINPDFENVAVDIEYASGTNFSCSTYGGRAAYSSYGVIPDACLDCHWYSPNIGASGGGTEDNFIKKPVLGGFTLHSSYPLNVTTPAMPASTVAVTNREGRGVWVNVRLGTATITALLINGGTTGQVAGRVYLAPLDTISLTYTGGTPSWTWNRG